MLSLKSINTKPFALIFLLLEVINDNVFVKTDVPFISSNSTFEEQAN